MAEKSYLIEDLHPIEIYGANNVYLEKIKHIFPKLRLIARGNEIKAIGEESEVDKLIKKIDQFVLMITKGRELNDSLLGEVFGQDAINETEFGSVSGDADNTILFGNNGKPIKARTSNQIKLVKEIGRNDIVFALGPAGTGKTYTAVAVAVKALKNKEIKRIILTRPAVEAGESLGFLPGDLKEKIDPYLRPLYDALDDMIPPEKLKQYLENRTIEVAPLAFMRGRTLDNCFVILDEAQNTTDLQIKMFLTRMGPNAKVIITGDLSQVDLPAKQVSGLSKATRILEKIKGISIVMLNVDDVVRHRLVKEIIKAYESKSDNDKDRKSS
ncbi:MAG: PhoH family protein [Bacteroidetes bacterium]|nr:PhoH family protein [Bacteroidota bacterium]